MPTKPLPSAASLRTVRDDARRLIRKQASADATALQLLRETLPRFKEATDGEIGGSHLSWTDALLAVAHSYGFASWSRLKTHLEQRKSSATNLVGRIHDELFKRAVELMDAGDADSLAAHLAAHPRLIEKQVRFEGGNYFRAPGLLAFIAENPVRIGKMPENVLAVAQVLMDAGAGGDTENLNETLGLVASGRVARECGVQRDLIALLCKHGADADLAMQAALAHGEFDAAQALLLCGAKETLSVAAALGDLKRARAVLPGSTDRERHLAIANASQHGHANIVRLLLDCGEDPDRFNPQEAHSHSTPLHQAALHGHEEVALLLVAAGARLDLRDVIFRGLPADWAEHAGHTQLAAKLRRESALL